MKRVQVAPGRFVTVSTAVADKAARVFSSGAWTRHQVSEDAKLESTQGGPMLGARRSAVRRRDTR